MFRKKIFIAAGVLAVAICFIVYWREYAATNRVTKTDRVSTDLVANDAHGNPIANAKPSQKAAISAPRIDPKIESFDSAADLAAFVAANSEIAMKGDAATARLISKAYSECVPFGTKPKDAEEYVTSVKMIVASTLMPAEMGAFDIALNKSSARCKSLQSGPLTGHEAHQWAELAGVNGDLSTRAMTLIAQHQNPAGINQVVNDIVVSQDADAMSAMGDAMFSIGPESRVNFGNLLQGADAPFAWKLASCEFGNDCGANGADVRTICLSSGHCGYQNLEEVYEQLLSPAQLRQVIALRDSIINHIQGGDYSGFVMSSKN